MSSEHLGPAVQRALLISELKRLRSVSGETQEQVAKAREWSVSKFTRIENGTAPVSKSDLEGLLRHYGVTDQDQINELTTLARQAREKAWWYDYDFGDDKAFESYVGYEAGASSIRMSQALVVPGLIQTPEYTRQTMQAWGIPPGNIARGVELRAERQQRVAARGPEQCYILDEGVIRRPVGNVMPEQLRHLVRIAQKPTVTIRVIPFNRGPHFGLRGPFVLLGFDVPLDDVLYLESARRGDLLIAETKEQVSGPGVPTVENAADEVARYEDGFADLLRLALEPKDSLEFMEQTARDLS
jgi:transcriptional regulator with XRE-family HTH domain